MLCPVRGEVEDVHDVYDVDFLQKTAQTSVDPNPLSAVSRQWDESTSSGAGLGFRSDKQAEFRELEAETMAGRQRATAVKQRRIAAKTQKRERLKAAYLEKMRKNKSKLPSQISEDS